MKELKFGETKPGKLQMVFCAVYTPKAAPYVNYDQVKEDYRKCNIPLVLMQMRWDGMIGFPGGRVDEGEDLLIAVIREMREEYAMESIDEARLEPLSTFDTETSVIHCYSYAVTYEELIKILCNSYKAEHFIAENGGCFAVQIANFEGGKGYKTYLNNSFAGTAKYELMKLVATKLLIVQE